eukprot:708166-Hanusia_phi.AAC.3
MGTAAEGCGSSGDAAEEAPLRGPRSGSAKVCHWFVEVGRSSPRGSRREEMNYSGVGVEAIGVTRGRFAKKKRGRVAKWKTGGVGTVKSKRMVQGRG